MNRSWRATVATGLVDGITASGIVVGFLALVAAIHETWTAMFAWLALALVIDAVDGGLARGLRVAGTIRRFSGETLDLIVDYLTYVLVPTYALWSAGVFPDWASDLMAFAILVSSLFYFSDSRMKTEAGGFRGFPALWNIVAFVFFVLTPGQMIALLIAVALVIATFLPVPFVHPFRVKRFRGVTLTCLVIWVGLAGQALVQDLKMPVEAAWAFLAATAALASMGWIAERERQP